MKPCRATRLALCLGVGLGLAGLGCGSAPSPSASLPDLVLVSIDTLRPDHLGLYGYERPTSPRIDAFFSEGLVFERAYTSHSSTPPSIVSLLSGRWPHEHGVRLFFQRVSRELQLLPGLLPAEYESAAFVANGVLTDEAMGLGAHFDHYDDFVDERESSRPVYERSARRTTDAALRFLLTRDDPERPLLLWVHYIDPHAPYDAPAEAPLRFHHDTPRPIDPERVAAYMRRSDSADDGLAYLDAYDEEIAYVDAEVGRLLDACSGPAALGDALFVLSADHGESMMDHERWFEHGYQTYEELARVPLALRGPGIPKERRAAPVSLVDVVPTLLSWAGAPLPDADALSGVDLLDPSRSDAQRPLLVEGMTRRFLWRSILLGDEKWMARLPRGERRIVERRRYDLVKDPMESDPQAWGEPGPASRLHQRLVREDPDPGGLPAEVARGVKTGAPKFAPDLEERDLELLRALGYVE